MGSPHLLHNYTENICLRESSLHQDCSQTNCEEGCIEFGCIFLQLIGFYNGKAFISWRIWTCKTTSKYLPCPTKYLYHFWELFFSTSWLLWQIISFITTDVLFLCSSQFTDWSLGYSQRRSPTLDCFLWWFIILRPYTWSSLKGPSIYDVHKKISFFTPSPVHMRPHLPDPLVDVHMRSTWNIHRSLELASTMTLRT